MKTLYLIPGTGADHRFFSRLELDIPTKVIVWEEWGEAKTIREYAEVLSQQINTNESFGVLGVSFGGMLAVEMSKFLPVEKLFIVSSAKSFKELPVSVRVLRGLGAGFLINPKLIKKMPYAGRLFGFSKREKRFFETMLDATPDKHLKRTIQSILKWRNVEFLEHVIQIHGEIDRIIPIKNIKNSIKVKGGGHFMIYNRAKEISEIIKENL